MRIKSDPAISGCIGDRGIFEVKIKPSIVISKPEISIKPKSKIPQLKGLIKVTSPKAGTYYGQGIIYVG